MVARVSIELNEALSSRIKAEAKTVDISHDAVASRGGPASPTMTKVMNGAGTISAASARKLEKAFGWAPGSVLAILAGGEPTPVESVARSGSSEWAPKAPADFTKALAFAVAGDGSVGADSEWADVDFSDREMVQRRFEELSNRYRVVLMESARAQAIAADLQDRVERLTDQLHKFSIQAARHEIADKVGLTDDVTVELTRRAPPVQSDVDLAARPGVEDFNPQADAQSHAGEPEPIPESDEPA
jgi:hypothetical protein